MESEKVAEKIIEMTNRLKLQAIKTGDIVKVTRDDASSFYAEVLGFETANGHVAWISFLLWDERTGSRSRLKSNTIFLTDVRKVHL